MYKGQKILSNKIRENKKIWDIEFHNQDKLYVKLLNSSVQVHRFFCESGDTYFVYTQYT